MSLTNNDRLHSDAFAAQVRLFRTISSMNGVPPSLENFAARFRAAVNVAVERNDICEYVEDSGVPEALVLMLTNFFSEMCEIVDWSNDEPMLPSEKVRSSALIEAYSLAIMGLVAAFTTEGATLDQEVS